MNRHRDGKFVKGTGGRRAGARNRLQTRLIEELANDFAENGVGVIRIVRLEKPAEYLKIVVSLMPNEFVIADSAIDELGEDELIEALNAVREARVRAGALNS